MRLIAFFGVVFCVFMVIFFRKTFFDEATFPEYVLPVQETKPNIKVAQSEHVAKPEAKEQPKIVAKNKVKEGIMNHVEIYTTKTCPYCDRAKKLLTKKGIPYHEIDVSSDADLRQSMTDRANGRRTVPQIFIANVSIGGCDDLYALETAGELDALLKDVS